MFEKFYFSEKQIRQYYQSALRDFKIASQSDLAEVKFRFSYDALLKIAITLCAYNGLRVKAKLGHHIELLEKLSACLKDPEIQLIGNEMRNKRNWDLYGGGNIISQKEADGYLDWLEEIVIRTKKYLKY